MTSLEMRVRGWMEANKKEDRRLEFKQRIELKMAGAKAEFIRDVLSLANSEGEYPREEAYLVIGFRDGERFDIQEQHYEGSVFSDIVRACVYPPINLIYDEFGSKESGGRFGVLTIRADADVVYVVNTELRSDKGRLLSPGQSWGRNSAGKVELTGEEISTRFQQVADRRIAEEKEPLETRIAELECKSGPALDVKRIRFEIEWSVTEGKWDDLRRNLQRLSPYAREFDHQIKCEVLDAVYSAIARMRDMPPDVAEVIGSLWLDVMPVWGGGFVHRSWKTYTTEHQELLERIEDQAFSVLWETCRYFRDIDILKVAAHVYWMLIRVTGLNDLKRLHTTFITNAHRCMEKCDEEKKGTIFAEGRKILAFEINDACDLADANAAEQSV